MKEAVERYPKLRAAAKGERCIACLAEDGTVLLAHRNEGKGMGIKTSDVLALDLCMRCHYEYDQGRDMSREQRRAFFNENYPRQVLRWIKKGLLKVA